MPLQVLLYFNRYWSYLFFGLGYLIWFWKKVRTATATAAAAAAAARRACPAADRR